MQSQKKGSITPNGVSLEKHEYDTVLFLTTLGYDIELIRSTLEHAFQTAMKQSVNIVFDLRRIQMPNEKAVTILEQLFNYSKGIKNLLVISKGRKKLLDYKK